MVWKRLFWVAAAGVFAAISAAIYALLIEPNLLFVRHHTAGEGETVTRVVHLSDLHFESLHVSPARVKRIVATVNKQSPDIVIITGDFVNGHAKKADWPPEGLANIETSMATLGDIRARWGVFATLGNHDSWFGKEDVATYLRVAGLRVLDNHTALLEGNLCVVGLADRLLDNDDPTAFAGCPADSKIVAAMHTPDSFEHLPAGTRLAVAGHTHGGQVNLPFYGRRVTATDLGEPYAYGLKDWRGTPVYISSGIGTSILPIRFRSPPEIAVIDLAH